MSPRDHRVSPWNGGTRALDGITVFCETDDGERGVLVRSCMPPETGLLSICRELDERPERWYITVISSPTTILGDLRGRLRPHGITDREQLTKPEAKMLGQLGRTDLLRA